MSDSASLVRPGRVLRAAEWQRLEQVQALHEEARLVRDASQVACEEARAEGYAQGLERGRAEALARWTDEIVQAQQAADALRADPHGQIIDLACALVARLAPRLGEGEMVAAMLEGVLAEIRAEQRLEIHVHPRAQAATQAEIARLRAAYPAMVPVAVVADGSLEPTGCLLVSEGGKVEAGLGEQLEALAQALRQRGDAA